MPGGGFTVPGGAQVGVRPPRPATVKIAVWLAVLAAVCMVLAAVTVVEEWLRFYDQLGRAGSIAGATADEIASRRTSDTVYYAVVVVILLLVAAAYVLLGRFAWRGGNGARVGLAVVCGVSVLCCGALMGIGVLLDDVSTGEPLDDVLARVLSETQPGWAATLTGLAAIVFVPASLVLLVLLLVPSSNRFFQPHIAVPAWPGQIYPGSPYPYAVPAEPEQLARPAEPEQLARPAEPGQLARPSSPEWSQPSTSDSGSEWSRPSQEAAQSGAEWAPPTVSDPSTPAFDPGPPAPDPSPPAPDPSPSAPDPSPPSSGQGQ